MLRADMTDGAPQPASPTANEQTLFEGHLAVCSSIGSWLIGFLTLGFGFIYYWFRARSVKYRLTTQRVVVETGLFSKRMDQIDIYRINDFVVERPFAQRLAGTGNIVLTAMDRSTPDVGIEGLKTDVMALYEKLRAATEEAKRARGVRVLDNEVQTGR
jgi:uncharacterized membrane protein YdbT with pleckstrin-like domain